MFFVYVLISELKGRRFYVGLTINVEKRVAEHNARGTKSTKAYAPWKLFSLNRLTQEKKPEKERNIINQVLAENL